MKKSNLVALVAFLVGVCTAVAGVVYYLKKKEAELAEAEEDMLYNEDYLADYLPKDEEFCECCCEEVPVEEETVEESCECCCEEPVQESCTEE